MHRRVSDLPEFLQAGDLVVVNDTKVVPARLTGTKGATGSRVEVLFVRDLGDGTWDALIKGTLRVGQVLVFASDVRATIVRRDAEATLLKVESRRPMEAVFEEQGTMPLPPYIKRPALQEDRQWYQTMFARRAGAIAAPTAGLHFTAGLVERLAEKGVRTATVTLHVGPGTFRPVSTDRIEDHRMGAETYEISPEAAASILETKQAGRRVVAVGTTVVRTLEASAAEGRLGAVGGETRLYITPGFRFRVVDALMTNFHLPRTTLLILVSAFAGVGTVRKAYEEAVRERYRFYSYGDAMLIL